MMNATYKEVFNKIFEPVGKFCLKLGLSPNQLTMIGLAFGILRVGEPAQERRYARAIDFDNLVGHQPVRGTVHVEH